MQFIYQPEGADPRVWDFDPTRLMNPEVESIERHTGMTFGEWMQKAGAGSMLALHGLLYVLLKRSNPTLKWDEVQFCMAEVKFEMTPEDKARVRAELEAKARTTGLGDEEAEVLAELLAQGDPDDAGADPKD